MISALLSPGLAFAATARLNQVRAGTALSPVGLPSYPQAVTVADLGLILPDPSSMNDLGTGPRAELEASVGAIAPGQSSLALSELVNASRILPLAGAEDAPRDVGVRVVASVFDPLPLKAGMEHFREEGFTVLEPSLFSPRGRAAFTAILRGIASKDPFSGPRAALRDELDFFTEAFGRNPIDRRQRLHHFKAKDQEPGFPRDKFPHVDNYEIVLTMAQSGGPYQGTILFLPVAEEDNALSLRYVFTPTGALVAFTSGSRETRTGIPSTVHGAPSPRYDSGWRRLLAARWELSPRETAREFDDRPRIRQSAVRKILHAARLWPFSN